MDIDYPPFVSQLYKLYAFYIDNLYFLCYTIAMKGKTTVSINLDSVAKAKKLVTFGVSLGDVYEQALDSYIGLSSKHRAKFNKEVKRNGRNSKATSE